ncbi:MAG: tagaturonate epimerase family protein [Chloroflexi bacterium]|nr:tagaturonate epimerase family protein [Chloroflexota bacterium]
MRFDKLNINPAKNPAILDTATWDRAAAVAAVQAVDDAYWPTLLTAAADGAPLFPVPTTASLTPCAASAAWHQGVLYCLAGLPDGQQVFLEIGQSTSDAVLGAPIGVRSWPGSPSNTQYPISNTHLALHPTDAATLDRFFRLVAPDKGPRALGAIPRLGIGTRMTTAVWPAIWQAMGGVGAGFTHEGGAAFARSETRPYFAANAIQNSVRELNFLETLLEGRPAEKNIAFGFGTIETGYTGSSYEGLWVAGVLNALKHRVRAPYGADADHIQVKRGADGLARAKRLLDATRYYSFYTLDVSDVLDYGALSAGPAAATAYLDARLPDAARRRELLAYHQQPRRLGGFDYRPDDTTLGRLIGKYAVALDAVEKLYEYICGLKACPEQSRRNGASFDSAQDRSFDLELSIDEHPNDVPTFDCLTSETELIFVLLEAERRGLPLTHIAPNFGVEKGTDYRGADGLTGFEARTRSLCHITEEFGVMPDFHSGDDLSAATRQAVGRATSGRNQFKVSPMLQLLFGEVLADYHPDLFRRWGEDALAYAQREAAAGSAFAAECLQRIDLTGLGDLSGLAHDDVFHHFSFAFVGRRDADGQFICREEFYDLSPAFYRAYQERIVGYLLGLAGDLFGG